MCVPRSMRTRKVVDYSMGSYDDQIKQAIRESRAEEPEERPARASRQPPPDSQAESRKRSRCGMGLADIVSSLLTPYPED